MLIVGSIIVVVDSTRNVTVSIQKRTICGKFSEFESQEILSKISPWAWGGELHVTFAVRCSGGDETFHVYQEKKSLLSAKKATRIR